MLFRSKFFDSKQAIGEAICADCLNSIVQHVETVIAEAKTPTEQIRRLFSTVVADSVVAATTPVATAWWMLRRGWSPGSNVDPTEAAAAKRATRSESDRSGPSAPTIRFIRPAAVALMPASWHVAQIGRAHV